MTTTPVIVVIAEVPTALVPASPVGDTRAVPTTDSSPKLTVACNPVSVTLAPAPAKALPTAAVPAAPVRPTEMLPVVAIVTKSRTKN